MPTVEFLNKAKKVDCGQYANLRKVAQLNGVEVYQGIWRILNCHGNGLCAKCVMEVVEGTENLSPKTLRERLRLGLTANRACVPGACRGRLHPAAEPAMGSRTQQTGTLLRDIRWS